MKNKVWKCWTDFRDFWIRLYFVVTTAGSMVVIAAAVKYLAKSINSH